MSNKYTWFLPYLIFFIRCGDLNFLKSAALCNLRYMMTKIEAFSLDDLIKDYELALDHIKGNAMNPDNSSLGQPYNNSTNCIELTGFVT